MTCDSANAASVGRRKHDLETPALCLDLDAYHRNMRRMADYIIRQCGLQWRPHMKGQKAPELARMAVEAGAIGVTCATVYEAQAIAEAGVAEILLAHQTVGEHKLRRLARLQRLARVISATDSEEHLAMLAAAARSEGVIIPVVIEVNVGMNRAGAAPAQTAAVARRAMRTGGIRLLGLMGWEGHALRGFPEETERVRRIDESITALLRTAAECRQAGIPIDVVSASGSGTFLHSSHRQGLTEVQAGGAVFCDLSYQRWGVPHEFALTVLTRVVSRPTAARIVVDGGFKAMSRDHGEPHPLGLGEMAGLSLSAEHATIELAAPSDTPRVGDVLEFIPGYTDSTVCLHDELCALRGGVVESVWTIPGRSGRRI